MKEETTTERKGFRILRPPILVIGTLIWFSSLFIFLLGGLHPLISTDLDSLLTWDDASLPKVFKSLSGRLRNISISKRKSGVQLGRILLKSGDPSGAEAICEIYTTKNDQDVNGWTCLGESRLALHHRTWKTALTQNEIETNYNHLYHARENFQTAITLNPTNPEARLGMGISLFLLGSRSVKSFDSERPDESPSQLLFNSVLHLNAAATLTSVSASEELLKQSNDDREKLHIVALYNAALVYMALGDTSSAIPLFKKVGNLAKSSKHYGINVPEANLGAALLQRGMLDDSIELMSDTIKNNCKEMSGKAYFLNDDHVTEVRKNKLCSILHSNLAVAKEMKGADKSTLMAIHKSALSSEINAGLRTGAAFVNSAEYNRTQKHDDGTGESLEEIDDTVKGEVIMQHQITEEGTSLVSLNSEQNSFVLALEALEKAAIEGGNSKQWMALSRALLLVGDAAGAVESGVKALNAAKDQNESDESTDCIENAVKLEMEQLKERSDSIENTSKIVENNDTINLRLEKEILSLKLELLQRSTSSKQSPEDQGTSKSSILVMEEQETTREVIYAESQNSQQGSLMQEKEIDGKTDGTEYEVDNRFHSIG